MNKIFFTAPTINDGNDSSLDLEFANRLVLINHIVSYRRRNGLVRACLDLGPGPRPICPMWHANGPPRPLITKVTQLHSLFSCVNLFRWGWGHLEAATMRGLSTSHSSMFLLG